MAHDLGILEASLGRWVSAFKTRNNTDETGVTESDRVELLRLRKENANLKLDRVPRAVRIGPLAATRNARWWP